MAMISAFVEPQRRILTLIEGSAVLSRNLLDGSRMALTNSTPTERPACQRPARWTLAAHLAACTTSAPSKMRHRVNDSSHPFGN